ncbi:MAG: HPr kinase/phosphatase C-terminal domain-containing protein [Pseudomonadota bacterium]
MTTARSAQLHASAVAIAGRGCLITGPSGSGKSTLVMEIMALGGRLVADDRVDLSRDGDSIHLSAPDRLRGLIEARGIGILRVDDPIDRAPCAYVVDLGEAATRLPMAQYRDLLGVQCPVILGKTRHGLAAAMVVLLKSGGMVEP